MISKSLIYLFCRQSVLDEYFRLLLTPTHIAGSVYLIGMILGLYFDDIRKWIEKSVVSPTSIDSKRVSNPLLLSGKQNHFFHHWDLCFVLVLVNLFLIEQELITRASFSAFSRLAPDCFRSSFLVVHSPARNIHCKVHWPQNLETFSKVELLHLHYAYSDHSLRIGVTRKSHWIELNFHGWLEIIELKQNLLNFRFAGQIYLKSFYLHKCRSCFPSPFHRRTVHQHLQANLNFQH